MHFCTQPLSSLQIRFAVTCMSGLVTYCIVYLFLHLPIRRGVYQIRQNKTFHMVSEGTRENELVNTIIRLVNVETIRATYVLNSDHRLDTSATNECTGNNFKERFPILNRSNATFVGYVPRDHHESTRIMDAYKFASACEASNIVLGVAHLEADSRPRCSVPASISGVAPDPSTSKGGMIYELCSSNSAAYTSSKNTTVAVISSL
jgi:hypothetical protein